MHLDLTALEQEARRRLDPGVYDYYAGGADDEVTLSEAVSAWTDLRLRPRVLHDVSEVSTASDVLGTPTPYPILVAPTAYHRLAHEGGEAETARGAASARAVMVVSTLSTVSLEEVAAAAPDAPRWFQLYVHRDRGWTAELVARAVAAGYRALVLTVDVPVLGLRPRDERSAFTLPAGMQMANVGREVPRVDGSGLSAYVLEAFDAGLTPAAVEWLGGQSDLPIVVKGVLRGDDAGTCVAAGAAAVVVSTHGGRQLDTVVSTAAALPEVVDAVDGAVEVYVDGGIRRGTDVVKAVALGARAVLVGRPVLWGLATGGAAGVAQVLTLLADETRRAMALCGAATIAEVTSDLVR